MVNFEGVINDLLEIPKAMQNCLKFYLSPEGSSLFSKTRSLLKALDLSRILFVGHSYNHIASYIPYYYLNSRYRCQYDACSNEIIKKECIILESDDFVNGCYPKAMYHDCLFVLISQSGESPQIKEAVIKLREFGVKQTQIWAVTNNLTSYLAQNTQIIFPINSGNENILGTKSYAVSLLVLYFIARIFFGEDPLPATLEDEIRQLIFEIKFYGQDWDYHTKNLTNFLGEDYRFLYFISKGSSLASAYRSGMHCKTYARTFGEGISLGLFLHGPFQIVDDSFRCVIITGDETSIEETIKLMEMITRRLGSGKVILINNSRQLSSLGRGNPNVFVFEHTTKNPNLAPIFEIVVLQFLLLQMTKNKGVIQ